MSMYVIQVDLANSYRFLRYSRQTRESRGWNRLMLETYKIHLACFSEVDVERVAIYAGAFSWWRRE